MANKRQDVTMVARVTGPLSEVVDVATKIANLHVGQGVVIAIEPSNEPAIWPSDAQVMDEIDLHHQIEIARMLDEGCPWG